MQLTRAIETVLLGQRGHLYTWAPVFMALGIGGYFTLKFEPEVWVYQGIAGACLCLLLILLRLRSVFTPLLWGCFLVLLGFGVAGVRANLVAAPVLGGHYYGPVEGRIVGVDRSSSGSLRLMLDDVVLSRRSPAHTPDFVRVSLSDPMEESWVRPGSVVMLTASLSPPAGPVEPDGFNFQRHAWFLGLGGVGYSRTPLMLWAREGWHRPVLQIRHRFANFVRSQIAGERGAFAAAIMTGDRSGMSQATIQDLRRTNLAHLLAISGLHMGLLTGLVFAIVRYALLLSSKAREHVPIRKVAAVVALFSSFLYLLLSGGNVATERAFIMATVALGAVLFERRVFSLRAVATAALIVLLMKPEALLGPGFQMSFAATTALVCTFAALRELRIGLGPRWFKPIAMVVISSLVAGLATAPVAAAHFNQFAHYGLIANLLSVPLMGVLVMPAAVLALVLWPLGLSGIGFWVMEQGVGWILGVANYVASLDGARGTVVNPDTSVLVCMSLGALTVALWQGYARFAGIAPVLLAFVLWSQTQRPDVLIADNGRLVGILGEGGRVLSKERGSGFAANNWLENDGDARDQMAAAQGWEIASQATLLRVRHFWRKGELAGASCVEGEILVSAGELDGTTPCISYDSLSLSQTGSVALYYKDGVITEKTARDVTGRRLWSEKRFSKF